MAVALLKLRFLLPLLALFSSSSILAQTSSILTITKPASNTYRLRWLAETGQPYQMQTGFDLQNWMNYGSLITGTGIEVAVDITSSNPKHFFRLKPTVIRAGFSSSSLPADDDNSSLSVSIGFTINLFGTNRNSCRVNNNGNITFNSPLDDYTPNPLRDLGFPIIAPFWADVDTRGELSNATTYGSGTINGRLAFGVNWIDVGYFFLKDDKLNSFQMVLIERSDTGSGNFDIEFNYARILWETGDHLDSGGESGLGGIPARAGISNGSTRTVELLYSGQSLKQLDYDPYTAIPNIQTGLIFRSRRSNIPGRFIFQVRSGEISGALNVSAGPDQTLANSATTATLLGSASSPGGGSLSIHWEVFESVSGTSGISFSNPNILDPIISIPAGVSAKLLLTISSSLDNSIIASDVMEIKRIQ